MEKNFQKSNTIRTDYLYHKTIYHVTVDRIGFFICLLSHQSFSSSKKQTEIKRAPHPTANFVSGNKSRKVNFPKIQIDLKT